MLLLDDAVIGRPYARVVRVSENLQLISNARVLLAILEGISVLDCEGRETPGWECYLVGKREYVAAQWHIVLS
jgi:hypothetical protein